MYEILTGLIEPLKNDAIGDWIIDADSKGTIDDPITAPFVSYSNLVVELIMKVYEFSDMHPEYELTKYRDVLSRYGLDWKSESMRNADVSSLDGQAVMALLMSVIRMDKFCEGAILGFLKDGYVLKWLKRLKELDEEKNSDDC